MRQLDLFPEERPIIYKSKNTGELFTIQFQNGDFCRCEAYPRSEVERILDITYYINFNNLEKVN